MVQKKKKKSNKKTSTPEQIRPPIVTVMGHVDHGKTTLLDAIRQTNVQGKEAGGITQSIGAYQIAVPSKAGSKDKKNKLITFIDTPGHVAFTKMRARGAQITDIVVLVVAANDGIKPQTIEAINHAKAAGVPIIVAVNKIDLPNVTSKKVKEQLVEHGLVPEDWGGDTIVVEVSAKNKKNLNELLEMVLLVAEMEELEVDSKEPFLAKVIESHLDSSCGPVASIIVMSGVLHCKDKIWISGIESKIRSVIDSDDKEVDKAVPSTPVLISGLKQIAEVGVEVVKDSKNSKIPNNQFVKEVVDQEVSLEDLLKEQDNKPNKKLCLLIKSESQGMLEAIVQAVSQIHQKNVDIDIVHQGVGLVTESDVLLAKTSQAHIVSLGLNLSSEIKSLARQENIQIHSFEVIYHLIEKIEDLLQKEMAMEKQDTILGKAIVQMVFEGSKDYSIAGVKIFQGQVSKGKKARVLRGDELVLESRIKTLKHLKEEMAVLKKNMEGGISLDSNFTFEEKDIIEVYS